MSHIVPVRRPSVAVMAILAALLVIFFGGLLGIPPVHRANAAPCSPDPSAEPSAAPSGVPECEAPLDPDGSDHAAGDANGPGGSISTDGSHDGATSADPVETRVTAPNGGFISIDEIPASLSAPDGYIVIGQQVDVSTADAGGPPPVRAVQLDVVLDSTLWSGVDPTAIRAVRDGQLVPECDNRSGAASPDPCELPFDDPIRGDDRAFTIWTNGGVTSWVFVVPASSESVSDTVAAGGSVTTDTESDGASPADPVETAVQSPVAGFISITEGSPTAAPPADFSFLGQEITIEAPTATASQPLRLTFTLDGSLLGGQDASTVQILRDGAPIAGCTTTDGTATPDPCVSLRNTVGDDVVLVVLSSHASRWNFAVHRAYAFSGFSQPVDNGGGSPTPVLNKMSAGAAVPVKFSLGGNQGMSIFAAGSPSSRQIACDTGATVDQVETTTNAVASGLSYHTGSATYTYIWKTEKGWAGTCRRLTVKLIDGTVHTADFSFKK